jgi:hypothetical protein
MDLLSPRSEESGWALTRRHLIKAENQECICKRQPATLASSQSNNDAFLDLQAG